MTAPTPTTQQARAAQASHPAQPPPPLPNPDRNHNQNQDDRTPALTALTTQIQTRLLTVYRDLRQLPTLAHPEIILHPADRDLVWPPRPPLRGLAAAQRHEEALVAAARGTLVMDVSSVTG
ncbi:262bcc7d-f802-4fb8-a04c-cb4b6e23b92a [Thermothielavioides terrestris]|uniref:262bcc7d-f802-4fb8-a04c-cb4b6e23b92a n=1 Tax=Thermothielavioides terrestris TaxID=2587410 RepID=A0A3S4AK98_9PEZI|nr:262bcc7d-f802-4fb8-a04c-cb4b6e23b92a [Thermothielavioides terrestris]